jgi:hypothetical protein
MEKQGNAFLEHAKKYTGSAVGAGLGMAGMGLLSHYGKKELPSDEELVEPLSKQDREELQEEIDEMNRNELIGNLGAGTALGGLGGWGAHFLYSKYRNKTSMDKSAQLGRLAARIKWAQAPVAPPAAPAVPAPAVPAVPAAAPAVPAAAPPAGRARPAWAGPPTYKRSDIPVPPFETDQRTIPYYQNAAITHAYKRQQSIDVDPVTGLVNNPYDLNAEQMRDLSHYMYPAVGEQYRLNELQRTGGASPYANQIEYDRAMQKFKGRSATNRDRLLESTRSLYPDMRSGDTGGGRHFASVPLDTMNNLRKIGWQSLQPPTSSAPPRRGFNRWATPGSRQGR